jgi:hypothetical protein
LRTYAEVVLVDSWTYGCINCTRTLPHVTRLFDTYQDRGLVVVGVHTPEFPFEKVTGNVQTAIKRHGIKYPVAQDNDYATWKAYHNQYWPATTGTERSSSSMPAKASTMRLNERSKATQLTRLSLRPLAM